MKQTMLLKLTPDEDQSRALLATMHAFNEACTYVGNVAYTNKYSNKFDLQKECYAEVRARYTLSAQLAILAIHKAAGAYKRDRTIQPSFRPEGAITYDQRIMSFKGLTHVSLLTLYGRVLIPFVVGGYQQARMESIKGQADLLYRNGAWFLAVTLDISPATPDIPDGTLGVDLGIVNLATDSTGETFSGHAVEQNRVRHHALRQRLQKRGTKSAKRHLKKLSGKQARFQKNTNHVISKRIVQKAKQEHKALAIEELRHIRTRTEARLRHSQRARHSNWSFGQLRQFLSYKATLAGVPLHTVDPRNTSRTCHVCKHCEKANRKSQASFVCQNCGYSWNADWNAAINISRASVMVPVVEPETSRNNRLAG